jgi:hypothetical protein
MSRVRSEAYKQRRRDRAKEAALAERVAVNVLRDLGASCGDCRYIERVNTGGWRCGLHSDWSGETPTTRDNLCVDYRGHVRP